MLLRLLEVDILSIGVRMCRGGGQRLAFTFVVVVGNIRHGDRLSPLFYNNLGRHGTGAHGCFDCRLKIIGRGSCADQGQEAGGGVKRSNVGGGGRHCSLFLGSMRVDSEELSCLTVLVIDGEG